MVTTVTTVTDAPAQRRAPARKANRLARAAHAGKAIGVATVLIAAWAVITPATAAYERLVARVQALEAHQAKVDAKFHKSGV